MALTIFLNLLAVLLGTVVFGFFGFLAYQRCIYKFWEYSLSEAIQMVEIADKNFEAKLGVSHPETKDLALKVCTGSLIFESSRSAMKALIQPIFNLMRRLFILLSLTPLLFFIGSRFTFEEVSDGAQKNAFFSWHRKISWDFPGSQPRKSS